MYRIVPLVAVLFAVSTLCRADEIETKVFVEDVNGDGAMEKIVTRKFASRPEGDYYYLSVLDDQGKLIWTGPKVTETENKLVFGNWDFGVSLPELLMDLDADGAFELIAPAPVSDVSPVSFRVLRWNKDGFEPVRTARLLEAPRDSGMYPWSDSDDFMGRWISSFKKVAGGVLIEVEITDYREGETMRAGSALVKPIESGFKVEKWLKPMKPVDTTPQEPAETPASRGTGEPTGKTSSKPPAESVEQTSSRDTGRPASSLARYMCQIGDEDLRNSRGERLAEVGEVLAQDRANFHKYGVRHRRDMDEESYFTTPERRQLFYKIRIEGPASLKKSILQGGAIVVVTVYPDRVVISQE